jgi:hypothetical protein
MPGSINADASEIDLVLKAEDNGECNLLDVWYQPSHGTAQVWTAIIREPGRSTVRTSGSPSRRVTSSAHGRGPMAPSRSTRTASRSVV